VDLPTTEASSYCFGDSDVVSEAAGAFAAAMDAQIPSVTAPLQRPMSLNFSTVQKFDRGQYLSGNGAMTTRDKRNYKRATQKQRKAKVSK